MTGQTAKTKPYDLTTYDGRRVDWLTRQALEEAARILAYSDGKVTLAQGSYNAGKVSASAGTHDGGGVVDLAPYDHARKVQVLRSLGFAAWYRPTLPGTWGAHVHAVLIGNEKLSPSARRQVDAYLAGRNGLANNGADDGPREYVNRRWTWKPVRPLAGVFAALRYDVPAEARITYLTAAVTEAHADVLTADEAQGIPRADLRAALEQATGATWAVRRRGEYVTAWRRDRLTRRGLGRFTQITRIPGLADWRNTRAFKVPLRDRATGRPVLLHVAHYPAGVEYGDTYRTDAEYAAQVAASRGALDKVGAGVKRRAKRRPRLVQLVTGDFNLDQHRDTWATLMQRALGAESVWTGRLPKGGDHGPRLISNVFVTGEGVIVIDAALIKAPKPDARLDHKAIRYEIEVAG